MELLDPVEVRVLGALLEKEATTPEYYPLSLNALINACNQKSNRDPVANYDEDTVYDAVNRLREKKLALTITGSGRVNKYAQRISETLNLGRREAAILCTLLLRGAQTLGEIKDRSERMFPFADLAEAETVLEKLADWPGASLVKKLPRFSGQKEARYIHLLSGEASAESPVDAVTSNPPSRLEQLESELHELRSDFNQLKQRFDDLEKQLR
ncbi:MAG: YceH family protein [Acidobacteriaceae bacterium]|nr:YceH family protein [Acidobacteriaceae bacterium]MBV9295186.1 YceH family protein [Acidobacteriaceae bacterium]MBV9767476.1 YceH family protein [Acidobacteriaceae bacterium]